MKLGSRHDPGIQTWTKHACIAECQVTGHGHCMMSMCHRHVRRCGAHDFPQRYVMRRQWSSLPWHCGCPYACNYHMMPQRRITSVLPQVSVGILPAKARTRDCKQLIYQQLSCTAGPTPSQRARALMAVFECRASPTVIAEM